MSRTDVKAMTEKSLFNVACKILGLVMLFQGLSSLVWAFIASRFSNNTLFDPSESASWFSAAVYTTVGLFFCARSSWVTKVVFRMDDDQESAS